MLEVKGLVGHMQAVFCWQKTLLARCILSKSLASFKKGMGTPRSHELRVAGAFYEAGMGFTVTFNLS